jgi:hypothetical protein
MTRVEGAALFLVGLVLGSGGGWRIRGDRPGGAVTAVPTTPARAGDGRRDPRTEAPAPDCDAGEVPALRARLAFAEMLYKSLWEEHFGHPVAWPADTPARYTAAGYQDVVDRALATCETGIAPRGMECTEPPCVGAFVFEGEQQFLPEIVSCPAWSEAFGDTVTTYEGSVDCGDGHSESVLLLSPYWEAVAEPDDPTEAANFEKRIGERQKALLDAWECEGR